MSIEEVVRRRGITEVLHFTTNMGLIGMLASDGILSRRRLPEEHYLEHVYEPNAAVRRDSAWLDYVNLSVTRINTAFFGSSQRWHQHREVWWCAVALDPVILSHAGVVFATTNNMYSGVAHAKGEAGLEALFAEEVTRFRGWVPPNLEKDRFARRGEELPDNVPTCTQAEVLYPEKVHREHFRCVYVATGEHADIVGSQAEILAPEADTPGSVELPVYIRPEVFES